MSWMTEGAGQIVRAVGVQVRAQATGDGVRVDHMGDLTPKVREALLVHLGEAYGFDRARVHMLCVGFHGGRAWSQFVAGEPDVSGDDLVDAARGYVTDRT